jgi:hypothetical protein
VFKLLLELASKLKAFCFNFFDEDAEELFFLFDN